MCMRDRQKEVERDKDKFPVLLQHKNGVITIFSAMVTHACQDV